MSCSQLSASRLLRDERGRDRFSARLSLSSGAAAVAHPRDRVMRPISVADVGFSRRIVVVAAAPLALVGAAPVGGRHGLAGFACRRRARAAARRFGGWRLFALPGLRGRRGRSATGSMISVSGGRACRDRDGVARLVVLGLRVVPAADLAARVGRSMVCLRRGDSLVSSASSAESAGSPVSNDDTLDVTEDTRLLGFSLASLAVEGAAILRDDRP